MSDETITIDGHEIGLSHLDKTLFPKTGLTKRDLVGYYHRIAEPALPYYRDRPLSMQRFPDGIAKPGFFQKHAPDYFPEWIERVRLPKEDGEVEYVVANDAATLVYLANQGCITPHLALARSDKPDNPDRLIFDLDPSDDDFAKVRQAALRLKEMLDGLGLPAFVQTTGSRGLHVVTPLDRSADFDTVREIAMDMAERLARRHPKTLTVEQRKANRGKRVYIDCMRNAYGQTAVAPYAVRAIEGAPVATPLRWKELSGGMSAQRYTIETIFRRLAQVRDPWAGMAERSVAIGKVSSGLKSVA